MVIIYCSKVNAVCLFCDCFLNFITLILGINRKLPLACLLLKLPERELFIYKSARLFQVLPEKFALFGVALIGRFEADVDMEDMR